MATLTMCTDTSMDNVLKFVAVETRQLVLVCTLCVVDAPSPPLPSPPPPFPSPLLWSPGPATISAKEAQS